MKIKTQLLQEMVAKAIKGASMNKMIPITGLIGIDVDHDTLTLITTDGNNTLYIKSKIEEAFKEAEYPKYYTIVDADTFSKLIGKTTKEFIYLENNDNYLNIKGNGEYKLEIPINEDGQLIKFTDHPIPSSTEYQLPLNDLKVALNTAKASIAKTMEIPCLTGYYLGNKIITTDRQLVSYIDQNLNISPLLISNETANLLQLLEGESVKVYNKDNELWFITDSAIIYGKELEGKQGYPVDPIENLVKLDYQYSVKVDKQEILNVLDRMSLFVTDYDRNGIYLTFAPEGLIIKSQKSNAEELIEIKNTVENKFDCLIDIEMLKSQIQSISADLVEIYYGQTKSIEIKDGNTILIISLIDKAE